ncbi:Gfo/Idh/MocA family oxidoreductase [Zafaria sp. Z1313]|uniref:Gfo/Idh/MocA family oxidoreductase n=1 Tax=unclassified Zafaria TaxID=2828765 RepID=UPI002E777F64|nr:Gfo/Idh/MocA family oxidoreductase [Zafaria sp. J156]MEE1619773.1 Gfo/Idh/MocA family oxidoreductase [Zafaria sp. J156]
MAAAIRLGLVGYGTGGRYFHAPFIEAADGVELAGIVTRSAARREAAAADYPGVPLFDSLAELLASGVHAVAITTPPETRRELVLEALTAGVHVVADKPFAPTAETGRELLRAAESAGVVLNAFHNRRWDTDLVTLRSVLDSGAIGDVARFESRLDQDQPGSLDAGPGGGLLRDLGSHLVDQALWLFGPAVGVHAALEWTELPAGRTDSGFALTITHAGGVRSRLAGSKTHRLESRELRLLGSRGNYVSTYSDVQADAAIAGRRPAVDPQGWGYEEESRWGTLTTADGRVRVPSLQGAYQEYYRRFALAVFAGGEGPVPAREAVHVLEVLDAARLSDAEDRVVHLPAEGQRSAGRAFRGTPRVVAPVELG